MSVFEVLIAFNMNIIWGHFYQIGEFFLFTICLLLFSCVAISFCHLYIQSGDSFGVSLVLWYMNNVDEYSDRKTCQPVLRVWHL